MDYTSYKLVHLIGIMALFVGLGASFDRENKRIKWTGPVHGIALLLILVAGFGMLSSLGIRHSQLPGWVIGKIVIWLFLGLALTLVKRKILSTSILIPLLIGGGGVAAYLALWKP